MMTIFFKLSYVKMHLPYRKSNIQRKWSDCGQISYLNSMKLSSLQNILYSEDPSPPTTLPAIPPGQPPHPAGHPTRPATRPGPSPHPACHPTLPATPPCQPAFPESLASLLTHDGVVSVATLLCRPHPPAKPVCVGCKSTCNPLQHPI